MDGERRADGASETLCGKHKKTGRGMATGFFKSAFRSDKLLVGARRLELPTPTMSRWCSNQLSYAPEEGEMIPTPYRVCKQ